MENENIERVERVEDGQTSSLNSTSNKAAFWLLAALSFLLPIFFIPVFGISLNIAKMTLMEIVVVAALLVWLIARLREGSFSFPKSSILGAAFLIPIVMFISAIFSGATKVSLLGFGGESGTVIAFSVFFLLMFLGSILFQDTKRVFHIYTFIALSSLVLALFQISRFIFGPDLFSFGFFTDNTANLLGKWNDMSLFFGFIAILSLFTLQTLRIRGMARVAAIIVLAAALLFLAITNFSLSWVLVGIFSLVILVYAMILGGGARAEAQERNAVSRYTVPVSSLVVAIISLLFLLPGGSISGFLSTQLGVSNVEVRPSWSATFDITKEALKKDPVLGVGPNRFSRIWYQFKPDGVNNTPFWNTDFNFGIGMIPSFGVTTGTLGILAWLLFLISFIYVGGRAVLAQREDLLMKYMISSSFIASFYFWIAAIFYVPNATNLFMAFLFTGIFIALLTKDGAIKRSDISFFKSPRVGFVSVLVLIILIIASVVGEYFLVQRFLSNTSFGRGLTELNAGNINEAKARVTRALGLYESDIYYRALSDIQISQLGSILSQGGVGEDAIRAQFQSVLGGAIDSARKATDFDKTNYLNWVSLGRVYESVVPLGIDGAYDNANAAYNEALKLNPKSPAMYIILARAELARKNIDKAKEYLSQALELKSNYTEALFLLSQIEAQKGNLAGAIVQAERASLIAPNDIGVFFQLGFLRYSNKDYQGAISALERAVRLNPVYANAKYFLGLSYYDVGRTQDAIAQFEDVQTLNPDNKEVAVILNNLKEGRSPFEDIKPSPKPPEERDKLPVEETN